ncbi:MAG: accessory factor UbiK family protein [Rhodospirillales bacterium]|nr:accessory factor UbiK family protein [Rhodospirillales bacterium]
MQTENRFLEDVAKLATSALGTVQGMAQEVEGLVRQQVDKIVGRMDLVPREEFEVVREMAANARAENELLSARLDELEKKFSEAP